MKAKARGSFCSWRKWRVKLCDSLTTRAIPEHFCDEVVTNLYFFTYKLHYTILRTADETWVRFAGVHLHLMPTPYVIGQALES